jgi:PEP-CTERM motif
MDATQRTLQSRTTRWTALAALAASLALSATDAQAAPLRSYAMMRTSGNLVQANASVYPTFPMAWNSFLSLGPNVWAATSWTPPFTLAVRRSIWQILNTGDPATIASNPMIDYLLWRRDLNPTRFDHYHPFLGPQLGQLEPPTNVPVTPEEKPPITTAPQEVPPPVPEPNGLLLIGLVSAWGLWRRRRGSGSRAG